jgi:hypothetical protein
MKFRAFALLVAPVLCAPTASLGAPPSPAPGDSVRVLRLDAPFLPARFDFADSVSLGVFVDGEAEPRVLSRTSLAGIQVRRMKNHAWRGVWIGTILGGTLAYVLAKNDDAEAHDSYHAGITGAVFGAASGAFVGQFSEFERWEPARLPEPAAPTASVAPMADSLSETAAPDSAGPRIGDRVRVSLLAGPPRDTGWLVGFDSTSLAFRFDDTARSDTVARTIPREAIAALEVGHRRGHAKAGAYLGGLIGLGYSGLLAAVVSVESDSDPGGLVAFVVLGTAASAGVGALLGSLIKSTSWRPAPLP